MEGAAAVLDRLSRSRSLAVILALEVCVVVACVSSDSGPTGLIAGSVSRVNPETAKKEFVQEGTWRVLDDWHSEPREGREPVHILRLLLEPYEDLGNSGTLMLSFFNEKLDSATFFPKDMEQYLSSLRTRRGITLSKGVKHRMAPGTRVFIGVNATGQAYVTWEDGALVDQRRRVTE
jgi:hypothetical protein